MTILQKLFATVLAVFLLASLANTVAAVDEDLGVEYEVSGEGETQPAEEVEFDPKIEAMMQKERHGLISLYLHTNGDHWSSKDKWMDQNEHHCMWFGVICNQNGRVVGISLPANQLNGTIPELMFKSLSVLRQLDISLNYLKETVPPSISALVHLEQIDLSYNYLTINLENFNSMKRLSYLNLRWNTLITGNLESIDQLSQLEVLFLQDNDMSSLTLSGIGKLTSLHTLELSKSGLKGEIPDVFDEAENLKRFVATSNRLEGRLPKSLLNLNSLEHLDLENNMLYGEIGGFKSKEMLHLDLSNNNFTSTSKKLRISNFEKLSFLDFSGNQIGGMYK